MSKKNRNTKGGNIGSSLILIAFVLLCLVTFAVLSLSTAKADYNLSLLTAKHTQEYYRASNIAQNRLESIAQQLSVCLKESEDKSEYFSKLPSLFSEDSDIHMIQDKTSPKLFYEQAINDHQKLQVSLVFQYPTANRSELFFITEWKAVSTTENSDTIAISETNNLLH